MKIGDVMIALPIEQFVTVKHVNREIQTIEAVWFTEATMHKGQFGFNEMQNVPNCLDEGEGWKQ